MPAPELILLDLDGTLIDASEAIVDGVLSFAAEIGLRVPTREWMHGRIGAPPDETWVLLGADDPHEVSTRFARDVFPGLVHRTEVLPGVREALSAFVGLGCRLAAATNRTTDSGRAALEVTGLDAWVPRVFGRDLVAAPKPAPDLLHHALEALDGRPERALMIGDTLADVQAARAAGVTVWAVAGGIGAVDALREAGADLILGEGLAAAPAAFTATWSD